jgi:periplasmic protein TonB
MGMQRPRVAPDSANERLKGRFRSIFWSSIMVATLAHLAAFALSPEFAVQDVRFVTEELTAIELPPEVDVPPPPKAIARPATPVVAAVDVTEDITIALTTFEANPVSELPPPPPEVDEEEVAREVASAPTFTPFTVAPSILNREEILDAMRDAYPPLLEAAGVGGEVRVHFFIDAEGKVRDTRLALSSGFPLLDDAALAVADIYRFSPALNRNTRVPVWVSFPIRFEVIR